MLYEVITYTVTLTVVDQDGGRSTQTLLVSPNSQLLTAERRIPPGRIIVFGESVITSYSIHYTKLYEALICRLEKEEPKK